MISKIILHLNSRIWSLSRIY